MGKITCNVLENKQTEKPLHKPLEKELSQSNNLKSIGILAGGIAHDLNNIMTVILGYISLVKFDIKNDINISDKLSMAEKASLQAKNLAQQLLIFSKGGAPVKKTASIVDTIKDSVDFALTGSNVRCKSTISDDLWLVEIDEGQMNQVFNNLIINARQAMSEGGIIKIRAENKTLALESDMTEYGLQLQSGRHVKISIEDDGVGIPEKHLHQIFDPYFTSKPKGNGLGLATAYSIIKKHEGYITLESTPGIGTTFYIYLPASSKDIPKKEDKEDSIIIGKGKLLVMDDEKDIRDVMKQMLTIIGYDAEFTSDGEDTIKAYKKARETGEVFDAVIVDLIIHGGMGGTETIKKLLDIDPDANAVVSSGCLNNPAITNFRNHGFKSAVTKPYKIAELSKALHDVIILPCINSATSYINKT